MKICLKPLKSLFSRFSTCKCPLISWLLKRPGKFRQISLPRLSFSSWVGKISLVNDFLKALLQGLSSLKRLNSSIELETRVSRSSLELLVQSAYQFESLHLHQFAIQKRLPPVYLQPKALNRAGSQWSRTMIEVKSIRGTSIVQLQML